MTLSGYKPSTLILWAVLSLPALGMIGPLFGDDPKAFHQLLHPTGEFAARFMIIGMMASGLMLVFRTHHWPRWLMRHRRDLGVAAFLYAALHVGVYVIDRGTLDRILEQLPQTRIWTDWLAFLIFVPLAVTSNNAAQRWLGTGWKTMQRMAWPAAVLVLLHWAAMKDWGGWPPALIHFGPLLALWAYRFWYWNLRPRLPVAA